MDPSLGTEDGPSKTLSWTPTWHVVVSIRPSLLCLPDPRLPKGHKVLVLGAPSDETAPPPTCMHAPVPGPAPFRGVGEAGVLTCVASQSRGSSTGRRA